MEFRKQEILYDSKNEWINIIPLGDIHLGNSNCDLDAFKKQVEWIKNKDKTYWIGMGDYIDAINYRDPRFDPKTIAKKYYEDGNIDKAIQLQIRDFVDIIRPIRDKCIGLLRGNHEETIRKYYVYDILDEIVVSLDMPRNLKLYDAAVVRLCFKYRRDRRRKHTYDIFCAHSKIGGRTYGYKSNFIRSLHDQYDAELFFLAHTHIKLTQMGSRIYFDNRGNECFRKILDAWTGCFLQGYTKNQTSYVEKGLFPPTDIGVVKVMLQPFTGDKHVSI